jgi:hypothetical protein
MMMREEKGMSYELQRRLTQKLNARIPRAYRNQEHYLAQNILRSSVNALWLRHGAAREDDIHTAVAQVQKQFPGFVPNILPPR